MYAVSFLVKIVAIYALLVCKIFGRKSGRVNLLTNLKSAEGLRKLFLQEGEAELLIAKTVIAELAAHGIQVFFGTKVCH